MASASILALTGIAAVTTLVCGGVDAAYSFNPQNSYSPLLSTIPSLIAHVDDMTGMRAGTAAANTVAVLLMLIALLVFYIRKRTTKFKTKAPEVCVWIVLLMALGSMVCNWMLAFPPTDDLAMLSEEKPSTVAGGSVNLAFGAIAAIAFVVAVSMR
jgi:hypothetical protein